MFEALCTEKNTVSVGPFGHLESNETILSIKDGKGRNAIVERALSVNGSQFRIECYFNSPIAIKAVFHVEAKLIEDLIRDNGAILILDIPGDKMSLPLKLCSLNLSD